MSFKKALTFVLVLIVIASVLLFSFIWIIKTPKIAASVIKSLTNTLPLGIQINSLSFQKISLNDYAGLSIHKMQLDLKVKGESYVVTSPFIMIKYIEGLYDKRPVVIYVQDLNIKSHELDISKANLDAQVFFKKFDFNLVLLNMYTKKVTFKHYETENFGLNLLLKRDLILIDNLHTQFYGGFIMAKGWYQFDKDNHYKVIGYLEHVNTALLSQVNQVFSQLMINTNGNFSFTNQNNINHQFQFNFFSNEGGFMKASLLQFLAQYVPNKNQIEELIKNNKEIPVSNALISVKNISLDKLSSDLRIMCPSVNLDLNVKFDIHVDGGFLGVIDYLNEEN